MGVAADWPVLANPPAGEFARRYRRRLHRHNEALLRRILADPTGSLDAYETAYRASFAGTDPRAVSGSELHEDIRRRRIVILGDFHTSSRVAGRSLELIGAVAEPGTPVALALEIFAVKQQDEIDAYLRGRLTLDGLRAATRFDREWGAPLWAHYAPVLAWARRRRIPVAGINVPGETLENRDRAAAVAVRQLARRNPSRRIIVMMGELHTAPGHLPARLKELGGYSPLVIHQSAEPIAWRLEKRGVFAEWMRLDHGRYARLIAHPLVHQSTFTFHVLSAEHPEPLDNWERAFRYTAKRLGDLAGLDIRPLVDRMHVSAGSTADTVVLTDPDGVDGAGSLGSRGGRVPPLELPLEPHMDEVAAGAARAIVRFSRHLNRFRTAPSGSDALQERETAAAALARLWFNPHAVRDYPATYAHTLARSVDRSLVTSPLSRHSAPPVLKNLFLGTGYARESESDLLRRIDSAVTGSLHDSAGRRSTG